MSTRSTKFVLGSLALLGFLSISLFWSVGMHQGGSHNCLSAVIQNEVCPNATTPKAVAFHLNTLQSLISNVLQTWQHFGALLAMALVALVGLASLLVGLIPSLKINLADTQKSAPPNKYRRWLSLFEHSPSFQPGRV